MPMPKMMAGAAIISVWEKAFQISSETGPPETSDVPKSPVTAPAIQLPNRSHTFWSRPSCARSVSTASGVAFWPSNCRATSPGSACTAK